MPQNADWWNILFVIVFGLLAWHFYRRQAKTDTRLLQIEEDRERERRSARLRAWYEHDFAGPCLYITNAGLADAREVTVKLNGTPLLRHPMVNPDQSEKRLIGAGGQVQYRLSDNPAPARCHVSWLNTDGERIDFETEL